MENEVQDNEGQDRPQDEEAQQPQDEETQQVEQGQVQDQAAAESPSAWKRNKAIGIIAALLVVAAAAYMIQWSRTQSQRGTPLDFLCESTGRDFTVYADPDNEEYIEHYIGTGPGRAMPCRFDDKEDAYLAIQNEDGQWVKQVLDEE